MKRLLLLFLVGLMTGTSGLALGNSTLVGHWHGQLNGAPVAVHFRADGQGTYNGGPMQYQIMGRQLIVAIDGGVNAYSYQVKGATLTVAGGDLAAPLYLKRGAAPAGAAARGGSPRDLTGKWCYVKSFSANAGGGSQTNECFVLYANGTYDYASERSMSAYAPGVWGGTASQGSDSGRWSATHQSLTARSRNGQTTTYRLARRNHPRNRDPMLCLDERCYVTYYQRRPW